MGKCTFFEYAFLLLCLVFIISSEQISYPSWLMQSIYLLLFGVLTVKFIQKIKDTKQSKIEKTSSAKGIERTKTEKSDFNDASAE